MGSTSLGCPSSYPSFDYATCSPREANCPELSRLRACTAALDRQVFKARDTTNGTIVAMKRIKLDQEEEGPRKSLGGSGLVAIKLFRCSRSSPQ